MTKYSEAAREFWAHAIGGFKKTQFSIIDPIKAFLQHDFRGFKDVRRQLENSQRTYDSLVSRYYGQSKTKEASALREDAWQLHESKKAYLKASMDFCVAAPLMRTSLDKLLIKAFSDHWLEMKDIRETETAIFSGHASDIDRIRAWSRSMTESDKYLKTELLNARKEIEERAEIAARPSRELDDYTALITTGQRAPTVRAQTNSNKMSSKQGWLFMRVVSGKPSRTTWVRRWFYVKNGIFGWLAQGPKSQGVEESEKIGVLLCNVRAAGTEERRFCFELKTKDASLLLQAENQGDQQQWLRVFDAAKQKALEAAGTVGALATGGNTPYDAAFALSPAVAPELAAKRPDGRPATITEETLSTLHAPELDAGPRPSIDLTALQRAAQDSESGRDSGDRKASKFELHRKSVALPQASGSATTSSANMSTPGAGLSGMINPSNTSLQPPIVRPKALSFGAESGSRPAIGLLQALTPATLVQPPAPTNLSRTALIVAAERGLDLGVVDASGGVPSSMMANQWGTANYGHMSRIERGEIVEAKATDTIPTNLQPVTTLTQGALSEASEDSLPTSATSATATVEQKGHRKTHSETENSVQGQNAISSDFQYPSNYPQDLVVQDAQLRMLFPNVARSDRVVLVCRGSWSINEHHDIPGRAYITPKYLYFYSNHMGFVLVSGIKLAKILDVSVDSRSQEGVLFVRIPTRTVTVRTHLEPLRLLHRRLAWLVANAKLDRPLPTEEILRTLTNMMAVSRDRSPSADSWHGDSPDHSSHFLGRRAPPSLRVDYNLFGGDSASVHRHDEITRFKLPVQPVQYAPKDMTSLAAEAVFNLSAKALFHVVFGDKSLMSGMLYFHRRTKGKST